MKTGFTIATLMWFIDEVKVWSSVRASPGITPLAQV